MRGVVTVGLLGTLEEVGWKLRPGLTRIWQGERDSDKVWHSGVPSFRICLLLTQLHSEMQEAKAGIQGVALSVVGPRGWSRAQRHQGVR